MNEINAPSQSPSGRSAAKMAIAAVIAVLAGIGLLWHSARSARSEVPATVPIKWSTIPVSSGAQQWPQQQQP